MGARTRIVPWLFVVLTVGPTFLYLWLARTLGWHAETCAALRLPLIFLPLVGALGLTAWAEGPGAAARLGARFLVWPRRRWTVVMAALVFPGLGVAALFVRHTVYGIGVQPRDDLTVFGVLGLSVFLFLFPGVTEELGWRGFLQPRLAPRLGPLVASVVVGLTWGLWHGFDASTKPESYLVEIYPWFLLTTVGAALILGWLGEHNGHSVPAAMVGHFGANVVFSFFPMEAPEPVEGLVWRLFAVLTMATGLSLFAFGALAPRRGVRGTSG